MAPGNDGVRFSYCLLPYAPLTDALEMIQVGDELGYYACYRGDGAATSWNPSPNAPVHALAVSGSTVYAGGYFTSIGGKRRQNVAALNPRTGVVTSWNPRADRPVNALVASRSTVYADGKFTSIGGRHRIEIAAIRRRPSRSSA